MAKGAVRKRPIVKTSVKYFAYILECADKTLYVGSTNDLEKRLHSHNNLKSGAHYTKIRRPVFLRYSEKHKTYADVRRREGELKRLTRAEKLKLCAIVTPQHGKRRSDRQIRQGHI